MLHHALEVSTRQMYYWNNMNKAAVVHFTRITIFQQRSVIATFRSNIVKCRQNCDLPSKLTPPCKDYPKPTCRYYCLVDF